MTDTSPLRTVAAGRGLRWWGDGWRLFMADPWVWLGMMVVYALINIGIALIPFVGDLGHWLLTPVFVGGGMLGCGALARGERLRVAHLFEGFNTPHFIPLLVIGVVNLVIAFVGGALALALGLTLGDFSQFAAVAADPASGEAWGQAFLSSGAVVPVVIVVAVIAGTVLAMLNWFAPAIVVFEGGTAPAAMRRSFFACWRNVMPFLVYGLGAMLLGLVLIVVLGGVGAIVASSSTLSGLASGPLGMVGIALVLLVTLIGLAILAGPVVFASTFAAWRDLMGPAAPPEPESR